jgi:hypothetical protein
MAKRLDTYSQSLLKANDIGQDHGPSPELEEHQWLFGFRADFLHRTVVDFLRTAYMRKLLRKWSAKPFNVDLEICKACLATIKIISPTTGMFSEASRALSSVHLFLSHAKYLDRKSQFAFLDDFISSLKIQDNILSGIKAMILGPGNYWAYQSSFNFAILYHCVSYDLGEYVTLQLNHGELEFPEPPSGLLSGCFSWDPRVRMGKFMLNVNMIEMLLQRGLDPNLPWGDRNFSFWQQRLSTTYSSHLRQMVTQADCDAIKCLLDHGADQEASVEVFAGRCLAAISAAEILEKVLSKEQFLALRLPADTR